MLEAKKRNLLIISDEIMCGMGRHGVSKTLFLTKALNLHQHIDIVTFGKSIATGAFPLSGCLVKNGGDVFNKRGKSVMQVRNCECLFSRSSCKNDASSVIALLR